MCLPTEAARRWEQLSQTEYHILSGKRGKEISIHLKFDFADFPHLSGMQYAQDADFGIRASQYYGAKLVPALLHGKMDGSRILSHACPCAEWFDAYDRTACGRHLAHILPFRKRLSQR